jgi:hypothetical protein
VIDANSLLSTTNLTHPVNLNSNFVGRDRLGTELISVHLSIGGLTPGHSVVADMNQTVKLKDRGRFIGFPRMNTPWEIDKRDSLQ